MKKRIGILLIFIIIGLISIEILVRNNLPVNRAEMNYTIYYEEKLKNEKKLLLETKYFSYYFKHYDEESYIEFADGTTYDIYEAFNEGYIFLGDLMQEIEIEKVPNFELVININKKQELARKITQRDWNIYYYHINDIQISFSTETENLLDLINANKFSATNIIDILNYMAEEKIVKKTNSDKFDLYENEKYRIFVKDWHIYFGDKDLSEEKIEEYHKK